MCETILLDLLGLAFPLVVVLASLILYTRIRKSGMLIIAIAFILEACEQILFGATVNQYYAESGLGLYTLGLYIFIGNILFQIAFTILMVIGLYMLYKEIESQPLRKG